MLLPETLFTRALAEISTRSVVNAVKSCAQQGDDSVTELVGSAMMTALFKMAQHEAMATCPPVPKWTPTYLCAPAREVSCGDASDRKPSAIDPIIQKARKHDVV